MAARKLRKPVVEQTTESASSKTKEPVKTISLVLKKKIVVGLHAVAASEGMGLSEFCGEKLEAVLLRYNLYKSMCPHLGEIESEELPAA